MKNHRNRSILAAGILGICLLGGFPSTVLACPLAPRHGSLCKYVDPGLFKSLAANAEAELLRLGTINATTPLITTLTKAMGRGTTVVMQYDSLLRTVTRPRVPIPRVFAAAWTLIHPNATVRVRYTNGVTELVNVGDEAQRVLTATAGTASRDQLNLIARQVATLAAANYQDGTAEYAYGIQRAGVSGRTAVTTGADLAGAGNGLAQAVRSGAQDMSGQSRAEILNAKAGIDQSKAMESALRLDAAEGIVKAATAAARARGARRRVVRDLIIWGAP